MKLIDKIFRLCLAVVLAAAMGTGCVQEMDQEQNYGFVQFRLYKSGSFPGVKASEGVLDSLYEASKIKIQLRGEEGILTPTVSVMDMDASLAEFGIQSEKILLVKGNYTVMNYTVYDRLDRQIYSGQPTEPTRFTVVGGGLSTQNLSIGTKERGFVKFRLVTRNDDELQDKVDNQAPATKAADGAVEHPFHSILSVDVTVENLVTGIKTEFRNLKASHDFVANYDDVTVNSVCEIDSLVPIAAGNYKVVTLRTYFDKSRKVFETNNNVPENSFVVKDNMVTGLGDDAEEDALRNADIPVWLHATAGYIKDAVALRQIWLDHNGPDWEKNGAKVLWNFDADVNVWLAQPGVQILDDGRVALIDFTGTGVSGRLSDAIGELTALRQLNFGTHSYVPGSNAIMSKSGKYDRKFMEYDRQANSFSRTFYGNRHPLAEAFADSPYFLESFERDSNIDLRMDEGPLKEFPSDKDVKSYACYVTELPASINNLVNLEYIYAAYGAMMKFPDDMSGMENLTDVEIFNCYDMTEFPKGLATLPNLISLTFACNSKVPAAETEAGLKALNAGNAAKKLQLLYLPKQKIGTVPDLTNIVNLGLLDIRECGVNRFEKAFGKEHPFAQFNASNNNLSELPRDAEGYFIGMSSETETINFSYNKFTKLPDIFNAKSIYTMGTIDFSYNEIEELEGGDSYKGVNCNTLSLGGNKFRTWPEQLFPSGSAISFLQLNGNGIEEITDKALEGENIKYLQLLNLSNNKLTDLPDDFNSSNLYYLEQVDMSDNRFDHFPYAAANNQHMLVFILRGQRDAEGNRCMKEWPAGIGQALFRLRALYLGSNDIGKVTDTISYLCYNLDISDNPNITIDLTNICPYIKVGAFNLIYSPNQDIRGCDDVLILEK